MGSGRQALLHGIEASQLEWLCGTHSSDHAVPALILTIVVGGVSDLYLG